VLRKKMWKEAGPPPELATRLFSERIMYLVRIMHMVVSVQAALKLGRGLAW
jgi:hypothetical protein